MKAYTVRNIESKTYKELRIIAAEKETSINEVIKMAINQLVKLEQSKKTGWRECHDGK